MHVIIIMVNNMNSIENQDKLQSILKYVKYLLVLVILVVLVLLLRSCKRTYSDIEDELIESAKKYISDNNIPITGQKYIEITKLDAIDGTELCSKASGVIVTNENGKLKYQAYLDCYDYESKIIKQKSKYMELNDGDIIVLNEGEVFNDPLYTLKEEVDITVRGNVLTKAGIYTVSYDVYIDGKYEETLIRKVIVSENDKTQNISGLINLQEPVLNLVGDKNIILNVGQTYREPGYSAVDYEDGKITRQVEIDGSVDTNKPGTYTLTYKITNSNGKTAIDSRIITVVRQKANLDVQVSLDDEGWAKDVNINVNISGSGYKYAILPNGDSRSSTNFSFTVSKNGNYPIKVYDIYENEFIKEVNITNIDDIAPSGTCSALVRGSVTEVEVSASDNNGIAGYSYILDNKENSFIAETQYRENIASKTVSVNVKDIVGNVGKIKCEVTIKPATVVSGSGGSSSVIDTSEYYLVATKTDVMNFARVVRSNNVSQSHPPGYRDMCLSFAYYHAYSLYSGVNPSTLKAEDGDDYTYANRFKDFKNDDKQVVLNKIYEVINAGQPCILHVNGNAQGTSRHYVTVVGYKKTVTSAALLTEDDLLILDSGDAKLERMDTEGSRFMITGHDTGRKGDKAYGYRIYILR